MNILIFKTDLSTDLDVKYVQPIFDSYFSIIDWSVDLEDVDNVLRIVAKDSIKDADIIRLMQANKVICEGLPD